MIASRGLEARMYAKLPWNSFNNIPLYMTGGKKLDYTLKCICNVLVSIEYNGIADITVSH